MTVPTIIPEQQPVLFELTRPGDYRTPVAHSVQGVEVDPGREPIQIRVRLRGGCVLDIPLTQDAIDQICRLLNPLRTVSD